MSGKSWKGLVAPHTSDPRNFEDLGMCSLKFAASSCQYVPLLNLRPYVLSAFFRADIGTFHQFSFQTEVWVLDHVPKPSRNVPVFEVEKPRLIIHAICDLKKNRQILSS